MGTLEFPDLGKHCSVETCKLIDFLPFNCDGCKKVFCLEHRSYTAHQCLNANPKDVKVLICPLCAKGVRLNPSQDPNITWDEHVNTDCDPSNYEKATKKKRCPVPTCREHLTISNKIRCRDCTHEHCLKHRFGPDHKCPGPRKPDSGYSFMGILSRSHKGSSGHHRSNTVPSSSGSSWWGSSLLSVASSFRASAESGYQMFSSVTNQAMQNANDDSKGQCSQCPEKLSAAAKLTEHVEKVHGKGVQRKKATVHVCPICSKAFKDPVLLVQHAEKKHRNSSKAH